MSVLVHECGRGFESHFGHLTFFFFLSLIKFKSLSHIIVQELCESQGGRLGLSVLKSLLVSVDVKLYCTMLRHWSQLAPNMSADIRGH